jgi:hypothetical protein
MHTTFLRVVIVLISLTASSCHGEIPVISSSKDSKPLPGDAEAALASWLAPRVERDGEINRVRISGLTSFEFTSDDGWFLPNARTNIICPDGGSIVIEIAGLERKASELPLRTAEKLNGVDASYEISFYGAAIRFINNDKPLPWVNAKGKVFDSLWLARVKGEWKVFFVGDWENILEKGKH